VSESLDEIKARVAKRFLGKSGIHSIGISRADNTLRVYLEAEPDSELEELLKQIRAEAAPYEVVDIASERASITRPAS